MRSKLSYQDVENNKEGSTLLYRYIRGSHLYGLENPDGSSDVDEGGVFLSPITDTLDLGINYQDQISNDSNDIVYYELKKYLNLLLNSNPTMLESLFADEEFIIYEDSLFKPIRENRDLFVTKKCFNSFGGYAYTQIKKCRGQHKMFLINPVEKRLSPLDFCYTFYNQGSTKIMNYLEYRGLEQEYCGLVNIPNMHDVYGLYYDWGRFLKDKNLTGEDLSLAYMRGDDIYRDTLEGKVVSCIIKDVLKYDEVTSSDIKKWVEGQKPIGYRGIICDEDNANELRLSSIPKDENVLCHISYNATGYTKHCIDYKNYQTWLKERNPVRFDNNKGKLYDRKNVSHAFRLMNMAIEIANGEGMLVNRRNIDREFLLEIKFGNKSYEEVMEMLEEKKAIMDKAFQESTLPEEVDIEKVNELMLNIRKEQIKKWNQVL